MRAGLAQRTRIVLLAAEGLWNTAIAERVGVSRPTVIGWRDRYLANGAGIGPTDRQAIRTLFLDSAGRSIRLSPDSARLARWARSRDWFRT